MDIVGLDLSLTSTGYARPDGRTLALTGKDKGDARLARLQDTIAGLLLEDEPALVSMEGYAFGINDASTRSIAELHGVVRLVLHRWGIPYTYVNPMHLKMYALGGQGKKEQMLAEAMTRFGIRFKTNDECDAFWLRAMALDFYGQPVVQMPQKNRSYLEKVGFPPRDAA